MDAAPVQLDGAAAGGQVLRTSLALAALLQRPVDLVGLRAGRARPGLRPQHVAACRLAAAVTGGAVDGAHVGSTRVRFRPGPLGRVDLEWDVGTAGSLPLLLQAVLPVLLAAPGPSRLVVRGGSDVPHAPSWDWFAHVHVPWVGRVARSCSLHLVRRGFAPRGGGVAVLRVDNPGDRYDVDAFRLRVQRILGMDLLRPPPLAGVRVRSVAHHRLAARGVHGRQAEGARARLEAEGLTAQAWVEAVPADSLGSACTVWLDLGGALHIGGDGLGARGVRAEDVGWSAADRALGAAASGATVDIHQADHLVPWVALGHGAVRVPGASDHLLTNLHTVQAFLGPGSVAVEGGVLRRGGGAVP